MPTSRRLAYLSLAAVLMLGVVSFERWMTSAAPQHAARLEQRWDAVVRVLAGDGVAAVRDSDAIHARFSDPFGLAVGSDGSIFIADGADAHRIRRITPAGMVVTVAGGAEGYADGFGAAARFSTPSGLAIDRSGNLYVADTGNNRIRRVTPAGVVTTVAGDGVAGYRDGPAGSARFNGPLGVAVDAAQRLIVADTYNDRIRAIDVDGSVRTIAGSGLRGRADGMAGDAQFDTPAGVAVAGDTIYVADTGTSTIRRIAASGLVTTTAPSMTGALVRPVGIAADERGVLYVTDDRGRVLEIDPAGGARTLAGSSPGYADGRGPDARFRNPSGIAVVRPGRLIVSDQRNALIRVVAAPSEIDLAPSTLPWVQPGFDVDRFAQLPLLWPIEPMTGPVEVAGTIGEMRGGINSERFHAGVDVFAWEGTPVRAVRDGTVTSPVSAGEFGSLNEWMRVGPLGYVHLRVGRRGRDELLDDRFVPTFDSAGALVDVRVKRGARFITGEAIGTVNRFNHVHLNVGWPGEELNPLRFDLPHFDDHIAPTIRVGGIRFFREDGTPLVARRQGRVLVDGRVQVVVDAWDQADGNEARRRLGLYRLGYQLLSADGRPLPGFEMPRETLRFDRLGGDDEAARIVYASGSGIPFFGTRATRFLYVVTNRLAQGRATKDAWDTSTVPPGPYVFRVLAADIKGNEATMNRDVPVLVQRSSAAITGP